MTKPLRGSPRTEPLAEPDADLVERACHGASEALAMLYERHALALYRLALRVGGSPDEAEDVVHDLFLGLPELLRRYEERGHLGAWLRKVAVRLTLARMQRDRRHVALSASAPGLTPRGASGERIDLRRALEALPNPLRAVFALRQLEGYSHDEIGELIGITSGASRVRYLRALRRLRQLLEPGQ